MILTSRFKLILFTLLCFMLSILSVLIFFLVPQPDKSPLTLSLHDITIVEGQSASIEFEVSDEDADVFFVAADSSVASIDGFTVLGLQAGTTYLRGSATLNGEVCYASCTITVTPQPQTTYYYYEINIIEGGHLEDDIVYMDAPLAFTVSIYDNNGIKQSTDDMLYHSDNLAITRQVNTFIVEFPQDGHVEFFDEATSLRFTINVKKVA